MYLQEFLMTGNSCLRKNGDKTENFSFVETESFKFCSNVKKICLRSNTWNSPVQPFQHVPRSSWFRTSPFACVCSAVLSNLATISENFFFFSKFQTSLSNIPLVSSFYLALCCSYCISNIGSPFWKTWCILVKQQCWLNCNP